jgi:broad specificity phosphatase PhoE
MINITLIRHAQSKFNAGHYNQNNPEEVRNCRLTEYGVSQAYHLDLSFDILIISPLKRALETYINSNIKCKELITTDLVREQRENHPLNHLELEKIKPESADDIRIRARETIKLIRNLPFENIGIITHAFFISYFLEVCGLPMQQTSNCQTITIKLERNSIKL